MEAPPTRLAPTLPDVTHPGATRPVATRPIATKPIVMPQAHTSPPARPEHKPAPAVPEGPRFAAGKKHGKFEICQLSNRGQCNGQIRDSACGPHTCPNADRVHACNICGTPGHPATTCRNAPKSNKKKAATKPAGSNDGKGGKNGKGGKQGRNGARA